MKIEKTKPPQTSVLQTATHFQFIDGYKASFTDKNNNFDIQAIGKLFFSTGPKWVDQLFAFRNTIVQLFGLKTAGNTSKRQQQLENFKCEPGEQIGLFKVFQKLDKEIIIGENDTHLNFRVSLFLTPTCGETNQKQLTISTYVQFNNRFGKIYFIPVRPFHQHIVPSMLKGIIKKINQSENNSNT